MKKKKKDEKKKPEGTPKERHARREAHLKLLSDSAAALQESNPALAAELTKTADEKAKRMAEKDKGDDEGMDWRG